MYSVPIAYLLWFIGGFGALGFHRFYLGKIGTGLLYLFSGGLAGIGCVYDFFTLGMQVRRQNLEARYRRVLDYGEAQGLDPARPQIKRETRKESIEKVILRTAKTNGGIATPSEVALQGDISLDDAKGHLEKLVSEGFAEMRVSKSGAIAYAFPDFLDPEVEKNLEDF